MSAVMPVVPGASALEIRLLGEPEVLVEGRVQPLPASKKARALLGYLVKTARPQRRERLCELLWDGPDDPRAGLRWALAKLRPLLNVGGAVRLIADRERVAFESEGAEIDLLALERAARSGLERATDEQLESALARFRGPFLEGIELVGCPAFHAWCVAEREALRALHVGLLTHLADRLRKEPARGITHARALVALDPLAESPRLLLLDLLLELGDTQRVLAEYDEYARTLRRELDMSPSFELDRRRLAALRAPRASVSPVPRAASTRPRSARSESVVPDDAAPFGRGPEGNPSGSAPSAPFVGRARERALLTELLEGAGVRAPVLLVMGEPGIGKTRLLEELARLARERGGVAVAGRAFEAELVRPYGPFIEALQGFAATESSAGRPPAPFKSATLDRTVLYESVLGELSARAAAQAPVVLVLDDLHWFDEASAELLHYLARALVGQRVLFALSARTGELADNAAAQRLVRALGRQRLATSIELGPLDSGELAALVGTAHPNAALRRILGEAGGNPLFAIEAARAIEAGSEDLVGSLSQLISERLGRLQEGERGLLSWAAALGRSFDVDVLGRVTGIAPAELLTSLERLERHAILRSRGSGYDFAHDLVRQAAYRQMSAPRQRLVHAQIARALWTGPDPELASDVAHHAALAGDAALAARACITAGRRCMRLFAAREARELALRGGRFAALLPDAERVPLAVELVALQVLAEEHPDVDDTLVRLAADARSLGLPAVEARAFFLRSVLQFRTGDSKAAFESSLCRVEAARHGSPLELASELAGAARCTLMLGKNTDVAAELIARAHAIFGDDAEHMEFVWARGELARVRGELEHAAEHLSRALFLARRQHAYYEECECLLALAWIDLDRGQPARAIAHAEAITSVAHKLGDGAYAPMADTVRALAVALQEPQPSFEAFERCASALERAGANRVLSILLSRAAELALRTGDSERARVYAERALTSAERVERVNEAAAARAILAEIALDHAGGEHANRHLAQLAAYSLGPDLSARNIQAFTRLRERAGADGSAPPGERCRCLDGTARADAAP